MVRSLLEADMSKDVRELTGEEARVFLSLIAFEQTNSNEAEVPASDLEAIMEKHFAGLAKTFFGQVMIKRLTAGPQEARYSPFALTFLLTLTDRVGIAVFWAYTAFDYFRKNGSALTMARLADCYPVGFPTEQAIHDLWDEQKVGRGERQAGFSDNKIDSAEAWTL